MKTVVLTLCLFIAGGIAAAGEGDPHTLIPDVSIRVPGSGTTSLLAFCREQPTMVSLVYSRCGGICYPFLFSFRDRIAGVEHAEKEYRLLILSFDERDTEDDMAAMARAAGLDHDPKWMFGTIDRADIRRLAEALRFDFSRDSVTGQLDHPPIIAGVDRTGRIVSIIRQFELTSADLWQMYREIQDEYIPLARTQKPTLISCLRYDPRQGEFTFDWGMLVLYVPVVIGGFLVWLVFSAHRPSRRLSRTGP